jgi:hypothetical protein
MDIQKFINSRPFLYHLTCNENAENIIKSRELFSANELIQRTANEQYWPISRQRRAEHVLIVLDRQPIYLRDQRPISEKNLAKCLTDNWKVPDFIEFLNDRVFMWPSISRLSSHYNRYEREKPVILRFSTEKLINANKHVKFCRLNSGATRSNSYLRGAPPARGPQSFLPADQFNFPIGQVAEVTFERICKIVGEFAYGSSPTGKFNPI